MGVNLVISIFVGILGIYLIFAIWVIFRTKKSIYGSFASIATENNKKISLQKTNKKRKNEDNYLKYIFSCGRYKNLIDVRGLVLENRQTLENYLKLCGHFDSADDIAESLKKVINNH